MKKPIIEIKLLRTDIFDSIPEYATIGSAGIDLRAAIRSEIVIKPNRCKLVPTGLAISIANSSFAGLILPRSGLGHKKGLILGNSVGLIDSDYQGELMVSSWNRSEDSITIEPLTRFAQLIIVPIIQPTFSVVKEFSSLSVRNSGGFGHTGSK